MVLLAEVLLAIVVWVAAPVAPLEGVRGGHVDVLEVVVPRVRAVRPRLGEGEAAVGAGRAVGGGPGHGVAGHGGHHTRERDQFIHGWVSTELQRRHASLYST